MTMFPYDIGVFFKSRLFRRCKLCYKNISAITETPCLDFTTSQRLRKNLLTFKWYYNYFFNNVKSVLLT